MEYAVTNILDLPELPCVLVFSHLDFKDVCACGQVVKLWRKIANKDVVWRGYCKTMFIKPPEDNKKTFKTLFEEWHRSFGPYAGVYPKVKGLYDQLIAWLELMFPAVIPTLMEGASEAEISAVEQILGDDFVFPQDIRLFYRLVGGQIAAHDNLGLFGGYSFYNFDVNMQFMTLKMVANITMRIKGDTRFATLQNTVPFAMSYNGFKWYTLVREHHSEFNRGQIVVPGLQNQDLWGFADSFTAFLQDYVGKLKTGVYSVLGDTINLFPRKNIPTAMSRGIKVEASPLFIHERSWRRGSENDYFWSYSICMSMGTDADAQWKSKLTTRHWVITDGDGKVDDVQGPGVIGLYPEMKPGCADFKYESCCSLSTSTGNMRGTFQMKRLATGELFDVEVPKYEFKVPKMLSEK